MTTAMEQLAGESSTQRPAYLSALSQAQYNAVTADPDVPLQILAGPGSGKTRVLVARVTWLILANNVRPEDLVVVTFTNKAANEMRQRLQKLIGPERTASLVLGTFHATCARYLRRYAKAVGLQNNFSICDADEAKKTIKMILKDKKQEFESMGLPGFLKVEPVMSEISRAKAKDMDPASYAAHIQQVIETSKQKGGQQSSGGRRTENTEVRRVAAEVYHEYQDHLKKNNAVDFDDLLVYGVTLFKKDPSVMSNIKHVLVDEFQDTNSIQYSLMAELAGAKGSRHSVSVVGDPDQSIYGWRSAEVGNLGLMRHDFGGKRVKDGKKSEGVVQVFLEENYRSTGNILRAAKGIIESDSDRIDRGLYTSHPSGSKVVLKQHPSSQLEASFVATEVKRLVAHSGGLLNYDDFAILLRYNALSREVERQLQAENVPSRMLGGARFFERKEVKDILAYLTLADNPLFTPALERVINVPKRAIGDKALNDLMELAKEQGIRTMQIVEKIADAPGPIMGVKPGVQKALKGFLDVIKEIRQMALARAPVAAIIETLIKSIGYENHLRKEDDFAQRWENVKELINFSTLVDQAGGPLSYEDVRGREGDEELENDGMDHEYEVGNVSWGGSGSSTTLVADDAQTDTLLDRSSIGSIGREDSASPMQVTRPNKRKSKSIDVIDLLSSEEDVKPAIKSATSKGRRIGSIDALQQIDVPTAKQPRGSTRGAKKKTAKEEEFEEAEIEDADPDNGLLEQTARPEEKSPLRIFLEASTLSTDMEQDDQDGKSPKVTIATGHAAKGLEFAVVFVLAVEEGVFPFFRCTQPEEINEECRLLYVAATRAQTQLYLNYCSSRMSYGESRQQTLSRFLSCIADATTIKGGRWRRPGEANIVQPGGFMGGGASMSSSIRMRERVDFGTMRPVLQRADREAMAKILDRPVVDEEVAVKLINQFENSDAGARSAAADMSSSLMEERRNGSNFFSMDRSSYATTSQAVPVVNAGRFTSARNVMNGTPSSSSAPLRGGKVFDQDGWATGSTTGRAPRLQGAPPHPASKTMPRTSSFMDEYRLSKNHLAHEGISMNGLLGHTSARADVKSFQQKNAEQLKGFMDLLPADSTTPSTNRSRTGPLPRAGMSSSSSSSSYHPAGRQIPSQTVGTSSQSNHTFPFSKTNFDSNGNDSHRPLSSSSQPKKRLGMGRPRP